MEIPKQQILNLIERRMGSDQAAQAGAQLPDQVDHEQHADLLQQYGIDPQEAANQFGGAGDPQGGSGGDPSQGGAYSGSGEAGSYGGSGQGGGFDNPGQGGYGGDPAQGGGFDNPGQGGYGGDPAQGGGGPDQY